MIEGIEWLGHASFKMTKGAVIYVDPWELRATEPADFILITHQHNDHCSVDDIKKIQKNNTVIVAPVDCGLKLAGHISTVKPGDKLNLKAITVEAIPAYNVNKPFHPKAKGWVGFIIEVGDERIYHAGDTDFIPEMKGLDVDVALLPIGGTYTMDAKEAAQAAHSIKPRVAIPMHYGSIVGTTKDAERFKELCDVEVEILTRT